MIERRRGFAWTNILIVMASIAIALLLLELAITLRYPMAEISMPTKFDPRVGRVFRPGSVIRYTNYQDFALAQRANTLGFPDREPWPEKKPGTFRILALGDSYVEALQVPIKQKFQVALDSVLTKRYPGRRFETSAFGVSSAGTVAELGYYEAYGRPFKPDLVVVVFVHNDFSDDSPLLESVAYGWQPEHPPWRLFESDGNGGFRRLAADSDYQRRSIDTRPVQNFWLGLRQHLRPSRIAQWALTLADQRWRWSGSRQTELEKRRLRVLRKDPSYAASLAGWRYPDDLDHNDMFFAKQMPPVFDEAEALTDHAFAELAEAARRDRFKLLVLAVPPVSVTPWWKRNQREIVDKGMFLRLQRIAVRHSIPLIDLTSEFAKRGNPDMAHWAHDAHWNQTGHRWTASVIADFIAAQEKQLLVPPR